MSDEEAPSKNDHEEQHRNNQIAAVTAYTPLALQIGWIVFEWNRLQESLAELFADLLYPSSQDQRRLAFAVWHSTPNDRTQRVMLTSVLGQLKGGTQLKPRAFEDIEWLLSNINSLAGRRNNAIHAPFIFVNDLATQSIEILPQFFQGNPRASELRNKNLLEEFAWYREHLHLLGTFAERLHYALIFDNFAWPDRPDLPSRGYYTNSTGSKSRRATPTKPQRPPQ